MKIYYRKYNKGELYCCSLKAVKEKFKNTDVKMNFGSFRRKYVPLSNEIGYSYYKKHIKGIVISRFYMEYGSCNPMISFYIVNENDYSLILQKKFENEILQQVLDFYNENVILNNRYASLLVELFDGQLIIHKDILV